MSLESVPVMLIVSQANESLRANPGHCMVKRLALGRMPIKRERLLCPEIPAWHRE
jgi:hypothetical protein